MAAQAELIGTLILGWEDMVKERKATARAVEDGQRICTFYAKGKRADGYCFFIDVHGYCNYPHMDRFRRTGKEEEKRKEGAEARVSGKRPNKGGSAVTREEKQRQC